MVLIDPSSLDPTSVEYGFYAMGAIVGAVSGFLIYRLFKLTSSAEKRGLAELADVQETYQKAPMESLERLAAVDCLPSRGWDELADLRQKIYNELAPQIKDEVRDTLAQGKDILPTTTLSDLSETHAKYLKLKR